MPISKAMPIREGRGGTKFFCNSRKTIKGYWGGGNNAELALPGIEIYKAINNKAVVGGGAVQYKDTSPGKLFIHSVQESRLSVSQTKAPLLGKYDFRQIPYSLSQFLHL